MTNYKVYLTDDAGGIAELDTENIDLTSTFQVLDITNIGERRDNLKQIKFKGTKNNNYVFGSFYDLSRTSDFSYSNNLYFNYNPLRPCTALVYEQSNLIFKGTLRLSGIQSDSYGNVIYDTILTGSLVDIKTALQDKYLTDLSFADLQHRYHISGITNSWATSIDRYNTSTSAYTSTAFSYGSGYAYPVIDYGYYITGSTGTSINQLDIRNFKPAVYVKEYFDRIFLQPELSGYTYEVKGDSDFKALFNRLIIPDCQEGNKLTLSGFTSSYGTSSQTFNITTPTQSRYNLVNLNTIVHPPPTLSSHLLELEPPYNNVLKVQRTFTAGARLKLFISANYTTSLSDTVPVSVRLCKMDYIHTNTGGSFWPVLGKTDFVLTANTLYQNTIEINVATADWMVTDSPGVAQVVSVQVYIGLSNIQLVSGTVGCTATTVTLTVPGTTNQMVTTEVIANRTPSDFIIPKAPENIKQIDFLKGFIQQFNLVAYSTTDNPKRINFERYDDYYALFQPQYIRDNSLDWSSKVDYKNGLKIVSNINLPKSYVFSYKTDSDYFTDRYQKTYNQSYGGLQFNDKYGLVDSKKIESIFSPIVLFSDSGQDRKYPAFYRLESNVKKITKTNIRMGYYNGLQDCVDYSINALSAGVLTNLFTGTTYPQVSHYYLTTGGTVVNNLYFNQPKEVLFAATDDYFTAPNSYKNYYINQTSELTNPDVVYCEADVLLNEIDIANLDLRVPVYIQTGKFNGAYFKVLKVQYSGADEISKVSLQKITF